MRALSPLVFILLHAPLAWAYPEYAVRYNVLRCTACHVNPVGGGPRTTNGKLFGAHGFEMNPVLAQDYVGGDFRALYYYPQRPSSSKGGMGIMSGSVYAHVALDKAQRTQIVIEHNLAGFAQAAYRDTYALFALAPNDNRPHWFDSLLIGRLRVPFGIISDEHRTYTRVQTATEWYSYDVGAMLSGTPSETVHYDLAVVNGDKSNGSGLNDGQAERFGGVLNVRYMPGPVMMGASQSYYDRKPARDSRGATSLYAVASVGRWSNDRVPLSVKAEYVRARNWNDHLIQGFASDPNYVTAVKNAASTGWLLWLDCAWTQRLSLIYKYDLLRPDGDFPADIYERHGFGVRWVIAPNTLIQARTELARATHPSERGSNAPAGQNASYAILQVAF